MVGTWPCFLLDNIEEYERPNAEELLELSYTAPVVYQFWIYFCRLSSPCILHYFERASSRHMQTFERLSSCAYPLRSDVLDRRLSKLSSHNQHVSSDWVTCYSQIWPASCSKLLHSVFIIFMYGELIDEKIPPPISWCLPVRTAPRTVA